jgi:hypothetical protein
MLQLSCGHGLGRCRATCPVRRVRHGVFAAEESLGNVEPALTGLAVAQRLEYDEYDGSSLTRIQDSSPWGSPVVYLTLTRVLSDSALETTMGSLAAG